MKFSYLFYKYMICFLAIMTVGLVISSKVLVVGAILFVLLLMLALLVDAPNDVVIQRDKDNKNMLTNTVYENSVHIKVNRGFGMVILGDLLPEELELVSGSNYKVAFKWIHPIEITMTYSIRTPLKVIPS